MDRTRRAARVGAMLTIALASLAPACLAAELGASFSWRSGATLEEVPLSALSHVGITRFVVGPPPGERANAEPWVLDAEAEAFVTKLLTEAETAGVRVYLAGTEVLRAGRALEPSAQADLVPGSLHRIAERLGAAPALAGFIWAAPEPPLGSGLSAPQAERVARDWAEGLAACVRACAEAAGEREFVVLSEALLPVSAGLVGAPANVSVWRGQSVPRGPSLLVQRAALEAGAWGDHGALMLGWEPFRLEPAERAALSGLAAGCGLVILGEARDVAAAPPERIHRLREFADGLPTAPREADATLLYDPLAELCRVVRPDSADADDATLPTLAALNQAGRSARIAIRPPSGPPVLTAPEKQGAKPLGQVLLIPNATRVDDAQLIAALAAADRGWIVCLPADIASLSYGGGARPKESRDAAAVALPVLRTRPFEAPITALTLREGLGPRPLHRGSRIPVPAGMGGVWRGTARPGTLVLAEWTEASTPAFASATRGLGQLLWANGPLGATVPAVLGGVLDRLGVSDSKLPLAEEPRAAGERPTPPRQGTLDRYGLIPEDDWEARDSELLLPPPGFPEGADAARALTAYDQQIVGPGGRASLMGWRADVGRRGYRLEDCVVQLGAGDYAARRGECVTVSSPDARFPATGSATYTADDGSERRLVHAPGDGWLHAPQPGVYRLGAAVAEHRLVSAGGARMVRAERLLAGEAAGPIVLVADRPAVLEVALDDAVLAGRAVAVTSGEAAPTEYAASPSSRWWVSAEGRLFVDVVGGEPVAIHDAGPSDASASPLVCELAAGPGGALDERAGTASVLLDCYSVAEARLSCVRWAAFAASNTLRLRGAKGTLYGADFPGADAPARIRVTLNGRKVYEGLPSWTSEGGELSIPLPLEALHRGPNEIVVRGLGPNSVWVDGGAVELVAAAAPAVKP